MNQLSQPRTINRTLLRRLRQDFRLDWHGIHGASHWARVRLNGVLLAQHTGARADVVELFAFLHDSQRWHDGRDRDHGKRAASYVLALQGEVLHLDRGGLEMLTYACASHSDGHTEADVTVQTCWDADRLDLGRVGIRPDATRLCTTAARTAELIQPAFTRSLATRARAGFGGVGSRREVNRLTRSDSTSRRADES
jgi:uncharacterized protein